MLKVEGLKVQFGQVTALDGVSLTLEKGEILGLVGESGSGKSVTGFTLMGLQEKQAGKIIFNGRILQDTARDWRDVRGREMAMVMQDPMSSLNPVLKIQTQMMEACVGENKLARCLAALDKVGIADPQQRIKLYPHQFSGGMRQRVAIAIALLNRPQLIIADEPTTALDVTIQAQILNEMQRLVRETHTALIWITHDLSVVSGFADKIAVMYAGKIVEEGTAQAVLTTPRHPYTQGLLKSLPVNNKRGQPLFQIKGQALRATQDTKGCAFAPRCEKATTICGESAPEMRAGVRCFHA
jgi:peptide/nickel transport system ATP-binding protein